MKVISKPDVSDWAYAKTCTNCDSQLEIEQSDIKHGHSNADGIYPASDYYYVNCSVCQTTINIPIEKIPKLIQIEAMRRNINALL